MQMSYIKPRKAVFLSLIFLIGAWGIFSWKAEWARDYYQFWVVGQAIKSMELKNIYSLEDRQRIGQDFLDRAVAQRASPGHLRAATYRRVISPAGTPFFYAVFFLVSTGHYDFDYTVFRIASTIIALLAIVVLCDLLKIPRLLTIALIILLTELSGPFRLDIMVGNVNLVQVGVVSFILWLRTRKKGICMELLSGLCLGLLIMFKPNLAPVGILLLGGTLLLKSLRPTLTLAGGMALGVAIGFALPLVLFGKVCNWLQWAEALPLLILLPAYFYRSFPSLFFRIWSFRPFYLLAAILIALPFLLWVVAPKIRQKFGLKGKIPMAGEERGISGDHLWIGFGICVSLLCSTLVHYHYFVLLIPLLLVPFGLPFNTQASSPYEKFLWPVYGFTAYCLVNFRTALPAYGNELPISFWRLAYIGTLLLYAFGLFHLLRLRRIDSPTAKG